MIDIKCDGKSIQCTVKGNLPVLLQDTRYIFTSLSNAIFECADPKDQIGVLYLLHSAFTDAMSYVLEKAAGFNSDDEDDPASQIKSIKIDLNALHQVMEDPDMFTDLAEDTEDDEDEDEDEDE